MLKIRRSRLPLVVALLVVAIGFGGYYMFRSITLPQVHVTKVVDYKKWLSKTSGETPKSSRYTTSSKHHPKVLRSHKVSKHAKHAKHGKSKYARSSKHHSKAKLAKHKKHGKAKLAKGKRGKKNVQRASYKK